MAEPQKIREIAERNIKLLSLKSERGHIEGITTARIEDGLRCVIEDGPWRLHADLPVKAGGEESAPTPGVLGRGALASCLALSIAGWAARRAVPIESLQVEVRANFDARGELGMDDAVPPGYQNVCYVISVDSPAPADVVAELIEAAERHSPYVDVFARGQTMKRIVRLNGGEL
jgi:uncharacterized OsmC-like protein